MVITSNCDPEVDIINGKINQILKHLIDPSARPDDVISRSLKFIERLNDELRKVETNSQKEITQQSAPVFQEGILEIYDVIIT